MTRAGIVAVVGKPNAGKSTLLNRLIGEKLSIVSPKPQSTRTRVTGLLTDESTQAIIVDTPGLLDPAYALQRAMRGNAPQALEDADVIVYVTDATAGPPPSLESVAEPRRPLVAPRIVALNKADLLTRGNRDDLRDRMPDAILVSATRGEGVAALLAAIRGLLPESPFLYPADDSSTQSLRHFAAEFIRESALEQLDDEVPYSVACEIEEFREGSTPVYIRAVLHVERDSQKRILIGAGGDRIRTIGSASRTKIETLLGERVYLDLWVKVLPNWRRDPAALARLGFSLPDS